MVFSSVPAYLDPSNWQQQQHIIGSSSAANTLLPPPPPPPPQPHGGGPGSGSGSIRPGSMSERARLANIPMPETALKCPRCESTNTKFCYFNNYSLSQPRHFCKTCRRYWTRGGALRSVPVGGGCRRNKRTKSTSSKSPASSNDRQTSSTSTSTISTTTNNNNGVAAATNLLNLTPQFPSLRFMSPLGDSFAVAQSDMGLNYSGIITAPTVAGNENMNFHHGSSSSLLGLDPWRLQQQFPFLGGSGLDPSPPPPPGVYNQFQGGGELGFLSSGETFNHHHPQARPKFSSSLLSQLASVKMEDQNPDLRLSRQLLGGMQGNNIIDHQWNNNNNNGSGANNSNWTDLSSFSSSSTSNPLQ